MNVRLVLNVPDIKQIRTEMMSKDQIPDQTMLDEDITVSNSESGHCDAAKLDEK